MRRRVVIAVLLLIVVGAAAAAAWWIRTSPQDVARALVERGVSAEGAERLVGLPASDATEVPARSMSVHGTIEGEEVAISSELGGRIVFLDVAEGSDVAAGETLVQLDPSQLEAQVAQAEAAVAAAEAEVENAKAGSHPAEILAAKASVRQAQTDLESAEVAWDDAKRLLEDPQQLDLQVTQAQTRVDLAAAAIERAMAQLKAAEVDRDQYKGRGSAEEKWLFRVYDYQVQAAQAAIEAANAEKQGAEEILAATKAVRDNPLTLVSQVHLAESRYRIAEAGLAAAQARLADLEAGPAAEDVTLAQARLLRAQAALSVLKVQMAKLTLRSPISGVVTSRASHRGEAVVAGATLLTVADLDTLRLTVYMPADELGNVYIGQPVEIEVDSFPGQVFSGTVSFVAQEAEFTPKNVQTEQDRVDMVFAVRVRVPNDKHLLKPGMPADALFKEP